MSDPVVAKKGPYPVDVVAGKKYFWCRCGRTEEQPFCDGSHAGTDLRPVVWTAEETKKVFFCGCRHSGEPVLCDGSHGKL